jgi:hypothetical protein
MDVEGYGVPPVSNVVIPANAGIQAQSRVRGDTTVVRATARNVLDSRIRGNDVVIIGEFFPSPN